MQFDQLKRREFITLIGGAAAWPLNVGAQQPDRVRHVGVITGAAASDPNIQARYTAFVERLQQLGWTVGRNVRLEHRGGGGDPERLRGYAAELVALGGP
jgi:putative tryptophan/tyrosine transport system substrate-binding protein